MRIAFAADVCGQIKKLFEDRMLLLLSAAGAFLWRFFFPDEQYLFAAGAVLGIMALDLFTKLYALSKGAGGFKKAWRERKINSAAFAKGTLDKLVIFGVMLCVCGFAYRLSPVADLAAWFMQTIFTLMFLRDVLSIVENLSDAGVEGLGLFQKVLKKKMGEYVDEEKEEDGI